MHKFLVFMAVTAGFVATGIAVAEILPFPASEAVGFLLICVMAFIGVPWVVAYFIPFTMNDGATGFVTVFFSLMAAVLVGASTGDLMDCLLANVCTSIDYRFHRDIAPSQHGWGTAVMYGSSIVAFFITRWLIIRRATSAQPV